MVFGQKLKNLTSAKNDTIGKSISRGAEWCKFQLHSTFQCVVMGPETSLFFVITMVFVELQGFWFRVAMAAQCPVQCWRPPELLWISSRHSRESLCMGCQKQTQPFASASTQVRTNYTQAIYSTAHLHLVLALYQVYEARFPYTHIIISSPEHIYQHSYRKSG